MRRGALALCAALALCPRPVECQLRTEKLADGVFAILQPFDNRFNDSNAVLIVGAAEAMVIDSQADADSARAVLAEVRAITDTPVRYVVATHWHGDHFQGNEAYRDAYAGVEFVAHETAAAEMRTRATTLRDEDVARLRKARPDVAERLAKVQFVFPTMTVGGSTTWHLGGREVRVLHFRGHTAGDLVIHLPAERILVTGDLVDDMPYLGHGFPADYLKTLDALDALEWDTMVPGHGQVRRGRDHLHALKTAFNAIYAEVRQAVRDGLSLDDTRARVDLSRYKARLTYGDPRAGRAFDAFMAAAIGRMYEELR